MRGDPNRRAFLGGMSLTSLGAGLGASVGDETRGGVVSVEMTLWAAQGLKRALEMGYPMAGPEVEDLIKALDDVVPDPPPGPGPTGPPTTF